MPLSRHCWMLGLTAGLLVGCADEPSTPPPPPVATPEAPASAPTGEAPSKGTTAGAKATHVMDGRVRAMPPGAPATGAFFTLHNPSDQHAAVIGGSAPVARSVELHTHVQEDGQFKMRQIDRIDVPAGEQVVLEPGGLHLMLIGLQSPVSAGDTVSITLEFEGGHQQAFDIPVKDITTGGHSGHAHDAHDAHEGDHAHPNKKAGADPHAGHH